MPSDSPVRFSTFRRIISSYNKQAIQPIAPVPVDLKAFVKQTWPESSVLESGFGGGCGGGNDFCWVWEL